MLSVTRRLNRWQKTSIIRKFRSPRIVMEEHQSTPHRSLSLHFRARVEPSLWYFNAEWNRRGSPFTRLPSLSDTRGVLLIGVLFVPRVPGEKNRIGSYRILYLPRNSDGRSPIGSECRNPMWSTHFRWFPTAGNGRSRWSDSDYFRWPNPNGTDRIWSGWYPNWYALKTSRMVIENNSQHTVILLYSSVSSIKRRHSMLLVCHRRQRSS